MASFKKEAATLLLVLVVFNLILSSVEAQGEGGDGGNGGDGGAGGAGGEGEQGGDQGGATTEGSDQKGGVSVCSFSFP